VKKVFSQLLEHFAIEDNNFLHRIVMRDESWFHYFDLETKQESMKWHHTT
jgi:hypothetical protein